MSTLEGSGKIPTDGLVLYYDPSNVKSYTSNNSTVFDLTKNNYNASLMNGVSFTESVFSFDGTNDYILVNYSDEIYNLQVPMTIMGWFFDNGTNPRPTILGQYLNASIGNFIKLVRAEAGTFSYYSSKNGAPSFQIMQFTGAYQINTWNFFSVAVDGNLTSSTISLTVNQNTQTFTASQMATPNTAVQVRIGSSESTFLQSQEFFSGKIAKIFIYNRTLNQSEINNTFEKTKTKFL